MENKANSKKGKKRKGFNMVKSLKKFFGMFLLAAVFMTAISVNSQEVVSAQTTYTRMSALEARQKVEARFGGIIQKIEYAYDGNNPQYKGEALRKGQKVVFELNARTGNWEKWDVSNNNMWDNIAPYLSQLKSMNSVAAGVISRSGKTDTFVQKIELNWDASKPIYQGEAFNRNVKYSFEVNGYTGNYQKFTADWGDETYVKQYANVRPDGTSGGGGGGTPDPNYREINGHLYYFDPITGQKVTGWKWIRVGSTSKFNWKFFNSQGQAQDQFYRENGKIWLSQKGINTDYYKGWWTDPANGQRYYFRTTSGSRVEDWQWIEGSWRYFRIGTGTQAFGWQWIDNAWHYLRPSNGSLALGWQYIDGKWYNLPANGIPRR